MLKRNKWFLCCAAAFLFFSAEVLAQPLPSVLCTSLDQEIKTLEAKQRAANIIASVARGFGEAEASDTILEAQSTWKDCELQKRKLQEQRNAIIYAGTFRLTGYCPCTHCSSGWGTQTASGQKAREGVTVAADPKVLPIGTRIYIENVGERVVQDVGGAIKGGKIDIFVSSHQNAYEPEFNSKGARVWILGA